MVLDDSGASVDPRNPESEARRTPEAGTTGKADAKVTETYKACGAQLDYPPEARGIPWDEWIKMRPVAPKGAIGAFLEKLRADGAAKTGKRASGALPANTEWL